MPQKTLFSFLLYRPAFLQQILTEKVVDEEDFGRCCDGIDRFYSPRGQEAAVCPTNETCTLQLERGVQSVPRRGEGGSGVAKGFWKVGSAMWIADGGQRHSISW